MKLLRIAAGAALIAAIVAGTSPANAQSDLAALQAARELVLIVSKDTMREMTTQIVSRIRRSSTGCAPKDRRSPTISSANCAANLSASSSSSWQT
ncbi:MAG TPA: hypothetical protein VFB45_12290 [Pseudolabrys sp.]|nr:hypothetical protein [Pseudolabrys sp.]